MKINGHARKDHLGNVLRVVTEEQLFGIERERRLDKGIRERAYYCNRAQYVQRRGTGNTIADKEARWPKWRLPTPGWLAPALHTLSVTISTVWGICGQRAEIDG